MSDQKDGLLKAGGFSAAYLAIIFVMGAAKWLSPPLWRDILWGTVSSALLLALTLFLLRREGRRPSDVGISKLTAAGLGRFGVGCLIGAGSYGLVLLAIHVFVAPLEVTAAAVAPAWGAVLIILAKTFALGTMEELGFRGYSLRTLVPAIGHWPAQLLIAVAFAATHFLYGWHWSPVVFGVFPSALLFGVAATVSGGIAMPMGVHIAINMVLWGLGEKKTDGFWNLSVGESDIAHAAAWAPPMGALVTIAAAIALWAAHDRLKKTAESLVRIHG